MFHITHNSSFILCHYSLYTLLFPLIRCFNIPKSTKLFISLKLPHRKISLDCVWFYWKLTWSGKKNVFIFFFSNFKPRNRYIEKSYLKQQVDAITHVSFLSILYMFKLRSTNLLWIIYFQSPNNQVVSISSKNKMKIRKNLCNKTLKLALQTFSSCKRWEKHIILIIIITIKRFCTIQKQ